MSTVLETEQIKAQGLARLEELCRYLLPNGNKEGNHWKAGNSDGDPAGPSMLTWRPASSATLPVARRCKRAPSIFGWRFARLTFLRPERSWRNGSDSP